MQNKKQKKIRFPNFAKCNTPTVSSPNKIIFELGDLGRCPICESSLVGSFFYIFGRRKCINKDCIYRDIGDK